MCFGVVPVLYNNNLQEQELQKMKELADFSRLREARLKELKDKENELKKQAPLCLICVCLNMSYSRIF